MSIFRISIFCLGLCLIAATASAQSATPPPEKPAATTAAPAPSSGAAASTPAPAKAKNQNADVTREELTKKLECRKQLLKQELQQNKNKTQAPPPTKK